MGNLGARYFVFNGGLLGMETFKCLEQAWLERTRCKAENFDNFGLEPAWNWWSSLAWTFMLQLLRALDWYTFFPEIWPLDMLHGIYSCLLTCNVQQRLLDLLGNPRRLPKIKELRQSQHIEMHTSSYSPASPYVNKCTPFWNELVLILPRNMQGMHRCW